MRLSQDELNASMRPATDNPVVITGKVGMPKGFQRKVENVIKLWKSNKSVSDICRLTSPYHQTRDNLLDAGVNEDVLTNKLTDSRGNEIGETLSDKLSAQELRWERVVCQIIEDFESGVLV